MISFAPLIIATTMAAITPAFGQGTDGLSAPAVKTQAAQTDADLKSKIRGQMLHEYNLFYGTSRVTGGTIRECDPLRSNARNIAAVLKDVSAATLTLSPNLFGLSVDFYELPITETESVDLSNGPDEEQIYTQLNEMSERLVDRVLTFAKQNPQLLNALNGPKRYSLPNCAVS